MLLCCRRAKSRAACGLGAPIGASSPHSRGFAPSAQQHPQHRLGPPRVRLLARDQVEVRVRLDQAHAHVRHLVQLDRQREPEGVERRRPPAVGRAREIALELRAGGPRRASHARELCRLTGTLRSATFRVFVSSAADYPHRTTIQTRWKDNDVYGHVNNVEYYSFFDTAINAWLIEEGGLDIHEGQVIGVCAESHCEYKGGVAFPERIDVGLRVGKLG